jgi:hypothetical protein
VSFAVPFIVSADAGNGALATDGSSSLTILGQNFGPVSTTSAGILAALGVTLSISYGTFNATICNVTNEPVSQLSALVCAAPAGIGAQLRITVFIGNQQTSALASSPGAYASYATPRMNSASCAGRADAMVPLACCQLVINGTNFGSSSAVNAPSVAVVTQTGGSVMLANCSISIAHVQVVCTVQPLALWQLEASRPGATFSLNLTVALQTAGPPFFVYRVPPVLTSVLGPPRLSTLGGDAIQLSGVELGPVGYQPTVRFGPPGAETIFSTAACNVSSSNTAVCVSAAGAGVNMTWQLQSGALTSQSFSTALSYSQPNATGVAGGPFSAAGGSSVTISVRWNVLTGPSNPHE